MLRRGSGYRDRELLGVAPYTRLQLSQPHPMRSKGEGRTRRSGLLLPGPGPTDPGQRTGRGHIACPTSNRVECTGQTGVMHQQ